MASRGSNTWLWRTWGDRCVAQIDQTIAGVRTRARRRTENAWAGFEAVLAKHDYAARPEQTGVYNCRKIAGSNLWSAHAWGTAIDLNWILNPYGTHKMHMPQAMVDEILTLRTVLNDQPVFRWGGHFRTPDTMHFEIIATPSELLSGLVYIPTMTWQEELVSALPTLRRGDADRSNNRRLQGLLVANGYAPDNTIRPDGSLDGIFGPGTEAAVKTFQDARGLTADGIVGRRTWTALLSDEEE